MPERNEFIKNVEEMMELPEGTVSFISKLADLPWDSMQVLSFIAMVEEKYGRVVNGTLISKAVSVGDLYGLIENAQ